jgi:hypothetical protein
MVLCICGTNGCFGFPGSGPRHCNKCKLPKMINLRSRRCEYLGCRLIPMFNFQGQSHRRFCKSHSLPGMINVGCRRCPICDKEASYCYPGSGKRIRCKKHSEPGMVNRAWEFRKKKAGKTRNKKSGLFEYVGLQLNSDGTVKNWGSKIEN